MSDYNSSLPVRTENDGDVVVKVGDGTLPSQQLAVNADGSVNVTDNGGSLTVDGAVTVSATDLDIRDLDAGQDNVAISDGTDTLAVNADGSINAVVSATDLDIRDLAFASDKVDVSGSSITVTATDLDIRDLDAAQDSVAAWISDATGTPFSSLNPLPVSVVSGTSSDKIDNYNTAASVAAGASSNHDYTITALKTLLLEQIEASASGKAKIEVQVETAALSGVFTTHFVQFNSTATPNMHIHLQAPISVAAGVRVRVIRTNKDGQAQDLYSTISGEEV